MQFEWTIAVDPNLFCFSEGVLHEVRQPWPLDWMVVRIVETFREESSALARLSELWREGRDVFIEFDPEYWSDE